MWPFVYPLWGLFSHSVWKHFTRGIGTAEVRKGLPRKLRTCPSRV